jgi:hypothetical protein
MAKNQCGNFLRESGKRRTPIALQVPFFISVILVQLFFQ